ncbi:lysophospholipid acyltransferase family protein [Gordonia sp. (in: high G+C Gram-positive bacteria)]|uniref:lysophospholipid acyltransferase family protein n=1 Tax=unclassified Gordonia (in: high G+C Gram-positive bacteria) TaxID=2657482 RepID=UPI0026326DE1|nr:lysophospholipid acyltransferase family protein [Gordonia sp. (in: high G+C Gram-positive bacteria)]
MEPVFRALELTAGTLVRVQGMRRRYFGLENIPATGGFVLALNHTGYTDFIAPGLGLYRAGRRGRFLVKSEVMDISIMRFLVNHARAVPVDRSAGGAAYAAAVEALRGGEAVVVYPETTISRSFELREFKNGAVRMAAEAGVPVVPAVVWGAQRQWSKGTARHMGFARIPVDVRYGAPIHYVPDVDVDQATRELYDVMEALLHRVQDGYPEAPRGADWLPARLGGSAPTPDEAHAIEEAEAVEKARRRAEKAAREAKDR